jgi:outer membrane protein assembly factor BamB
MDSSVKRQRLALLFLAAPSIKGEERRMKQKSVAGLLIMLGACTKPAPITPTPVWNSEFALDQDHQNSRADSSSDSLLLVGDAGSRDTKVVARVDPKTGKALWTSPETSAVLLPSSTDHSLYTVSNSPSGVTLREIDPATGGSGKELSLPNPPEGYTRWYKHQGQVFALQDDGVSGFSLDGTGAQWRTSLKIVSLLEPAFVGGSILVGCQTTAVCQLSLKDGGRLATKERGAWLEEIAPLLDHSGALVLDSNRLSLTKEDGSELWEKKFSAGWAGKRVVTSGSFVAVLSQQIPEKKDDKYNSLLELLDLKDGKVLWSRKTDAKVDSAAVLLPSLALSSEWLIYGIGYSGLWAHNIKTGEDFFVAPLKSDFVITTEFAGGFTTMPSGDPLIIGSMVLFRLEKSGLYAYEIKAPK